MSRCEHTDVCWWIRGLHAEIFALVSDLKKKKKTKILLTPRFLNGSRAVFCVNFQRRAQFSFPALVPC